ncbi:hypothetical protein HU200_066142 [Digitaria exilis]|uniref:Uncharacterized protein n=1 Tax=Digitaria exilis TaxID=1010633 RepID=A0A835A1K2_9POAL|nr:hypothetical protein HU200_066142 [Digitaria exilis]
MELHDDSNVMEPPAKKCTFHGPTLSECLGKEGLEKLRAADLNLKHLAEPVEHGRGKTSKVVSVLDITTSFFAAVCGLLNLQKEEDPDILFLSETKMDLKRIEGLRWKIGMTNLVVKNCKGKSGGLAIFSFV